MAIELILKLSNELEKELLKDMREIAGDSLVNGIPGFEKLHEDELSMLEQLVKRGFMGAITCQEAHTYFQALHSGRTLLGTLDTLGFELTSAYNALSMALQRYDGAAGATHARKPVRFGSTLSSKPRTT